MVKNRTLLIDQCFKFRENIPSSFSQPLCPTLAVTDSVSSSLLGEYCTVGLHQQASDGFVKHPNPSGCFGLKEVAKSNWNVDFLLKLPLLPSLLENRLLGSFKVFGSWSWVTSLIWTSWQFILSDWVTVSHKCSPSFVDTISLRVSYGFNDTAGSRQQSKDPMIRLRRHQRIIFSNSICPVDWCN